MRKATQLFIAAVFAVAAAACGDASNRDQSTTGATGTSGAAESSLSMGERNFVEEQLKDGSREVQLGKLAEERASSAEVKEFAATMVQDHTMAGNKLKDIARTVNVELEQDENAARDDHERLSKLSGNEFDREYIDLMVKDHQDALDALQDQAENGDHPGVKQWASETLPRIKHHLETAQQLQNQLKTEGRS
ncbi:MAG TPA: DUF4142 domain-containing protein [Vicinamibacterales bacterium]|nr:DUF4142 domain-containing protein [Vicinamibacterales bacterium]